MKRQTERHAARDAGKERRAFGRLVKKHGFRATPRNAARGGSKLTHHRSHLRSHFPSPRIHFVWVDATGGLTRLQAGQRRPGIPLQALQGGR